jgi:hypothetical protein
MVLRGALHVHTRCSDGTLEIPEVVRIYSGLGFDFIALTDHDYLLRKGCYDKALAEIKSDLIVFRGVELTVFEKGYVHVNRVDGDSETLHVFNHPAELDLPLEKVMDRIDSVSKKLPLDAVEVTSKGFYTKAYDVPAIPYPKVATDDSHTEEGCGRAWIEISCRRKKDSIIKAIRAGDFWNCYAGSKSRKGV